MGRSKKTKIIEPEAEKDFTLTDVNEDINEQLEEIENDKGGVIANKNMDSVFGRFSSKKKKASELSPTKSLLG